MIDCAIINGDIPLLKCGSLFPSLKHLVLGPSAEHHAFPFPPPFHYGSECMTALYQHFPDSAPAALFPSLEVLEAYHIYFMTDAALLEFIIARIDATRLDASVSKLRKVLIQFSRPRQIDIVPDALAHAQAAGVELELELTYVEPFPISPSRPSFRYTIGVPRGCIRCMTFVLTCRKNQDQSMIL